jgi:hypothetical protein
LIDPNKLFTGGTTTEVFNSFAPSSTSNSSYYNPNNSGATQSATADANSAAALSGQDSLALAKDAASYMTSLGQQQQQAKTAAEQQLQSSQQALQQSAAASSQQQQSLSTSSNKGYTQSQVFGPTPAPAPAPPNQLLLNAQAQQKAGYEQAMLERNANIATSNNVQQKAQEAALQQSLAAQQGAQAKELAQLQAQSAEDIAKTNAAAQVQSSLFGSLGGMFSNMGGGGAGRHSYW